jgi:hypothetical protein
MWRAAPARAEPVISVAGECPGGANSTATARLSLSAIGVITALSVALALGDASRFNDRRRLSRPDPRSPLDQDLWRRLAFKCAPQRRMAQIRPSPEMFRARTTSADPPSDGTPKEVLFAGC